MRAAHLLMCVIRLLCRRCCAIAISVQHMVGPYNDVTSILCGCSLTHSIAATRGLARLPRCWQTNLWMHAPGMSSPSDDVLAPEESPRSAGSSTSTSPPWPFSLEPACRPVGKVCSRCRLVAMPICCRKPPQYDPTWNSFGLFRASLPDSSSQALLHGLSRCCRLSV